MNAPEPRAATAAPALQEIPLAQLIPSQTQAQQRRRARFTEASLNELAGNLQKNGQLQPILVRPVAPFLGIAKQFEIVLGERRFLAAQRAGFSTILATVRDLNDAEALEAQLSENLQRQELDPIDEAEGYAELHQLTGLDAEEIGERVGKSRSWVYARLQLRLLTDEAREAVASGRLDVSKALLLTRFRHPKLQQKALDYLAGYGERLSVRAAAEGLRSVVAALDKVPFALDDARPITIKLQKGMTVEHGACTACPWNSANDAELAAVFGPDAGPQCLESPCLEAKTARHHDDVLAQARAKGIPILADEAAAKIHAGHFGSLNGYVALDEEIDMDFPEPQPDEDKDPDAWTAWDRRAAAWSAPTWRAALRPHLHDASMVLIEDDRRKGRFFEAVPAATVRALVKEHKLPIPADALPEDYKEVKRPAPGSFTPYDPKADAEERRKREEERQRENAYRVRMLKAIAAKWKGPLKRQDLDTIATQLFEHWVQNGLCEVLGEKMAAVQKMSEAELQRWLVLYALYSLDLGDEAGSKPGALLAYCQRLKVDAKALKKEPASEPADGPLKKKAKGKK